MHGGGRGRLSSLFLQRNTLGAPLWHREGVTPTGGMDPQKQALGVFEEQASSLAGTGSLWDLAGEWAREMVLASVFFPRQTELCLPGAQQLSLPLSSSLPAFRAELLTYDLPDAKSSLLWEYTLSGPSAFASQTLGLCLARWAGCPSTPGSLPPVRVAGTTSALPTLLRGFLLQAWLQRVCPASLLVVIGVN